MKQTHLLDDCLIARIGVDEFKIWIALKENSPWIPFPIGFLKIVKRLFLAFQGCVGIRNVERCNLLGGSSFLEID
jgi:hypothetical protein